MQKIDMPKIEEEIEEGQQILPSKVATKSVLLIGILLTLGVIACIALMAFYPVAVLGLPLIAIVAYFVVRRR
jgi:VIT1/CCC1 family predicted Fe2+/Mn2+ transporter